ncbi:hypothetical protein H0H93_015127 [Arthromyces matolae]|nr:hypothetical protein H0H93_015127 [Arthromyces matolae]
MEAVDIICNGGINPYHQPMSQSIITVPAGATVTTEWHHTLAGADPTDASDPIDSSHKGPVISYLPYLRGLCQRAAIPNATQTDVTGLKWFKIWEDGYDASTATWGVDRMIANAGKVTFSIPSCIPAGQYLLRHEIIALHAASSYPGAQFYMECAQLQITGGGSASPATVSFPGAYAGTDPGITINIYYPTVTSYTIPGENAPTSSLAREARPPRKPPRPRPPRKLPRPQRARARPPKLPQPRRAPLARLRKLPQPPRARAQLPKLPLPPLPLLRPRVQQLLELSLNTVSAVVLAGLVLQSAPPVSPARFSMPT